MSKEERQERRSSRKESRKKFSETKAGVFLKEKAPNILNVIGDILPDKGALGIVKNLISKDNTLSSSDKEHVLKLIELDFQEMQEITKRWESDNEQDLKLPKLIRPIILATTWVILLTLIITNFCGIEIDNEYLDVYKILALTVNGAYFSARTVEKYHKKKYN